MLANSFNNKNQKKEKKRDKLNVSAEVEFSLAARPDEQLLRKNRWIRNFFVVLYGE